MEDGQTDGNNKKPEIDSLATAFFFDFDGTLAAIAEEPDKVTVTDQVLEALDRLYRNTHGALAIVSGRPIAVLDRFLSPLKLPASGVHGLEWRDARGDVHHNSYDPASLERLRQGATEFAEGRAGLIVEEKPGSVALHYRQRPDLEERCRRLGEQLAASIPGVAVMEGKMVVELRLGGRSKADAVYEFMATAPFHGRRPLFAGDDVTDEDAFRFVEEMGGAGIKIGGGETAASLRMPDREAFEAWLRALADAPADGAAFHSGGLIQRAATPGATAKMSGA